MFVLPYLIASVTTFICILILRKYAHTLSLVDHAKGHKQHDGIVPLVGGIAMFVGFLVGVSTTNSFNAYSSLLLGSVILMLVGIIDDILHLSPKSKFIAQIFVVLLMVNQGIILQNLGNLLFFGNISLGRFAIPFTVFAALGIINAINMLDGLDGLAAGITFSIVTMLILLTQMQHSSSASTLLVFASVLLPFLYFNLEKKHKRIFMGNGGSMFLGYTLVWFLIYLSQGEHKVVSPSTMLCVMALPLFDTWRVMFYRIKSKQSPFKSDRQHIHHIFLALGLSPRQTTFTIVGMSFAIGFITLVGNYYRVHESLLFLGFMTSFFVYLKLNRYWLNKAKAMLQIATISKLDEAA